MAKLGINTGSSPDAGNGDALLVGAIKINSNFNEIYSAIGDGSNITNSIGYASTAGIATYASASRIVIKDSGSTVGTAGTIDFGANLTVSAISAGVVTVTASGGTSSQWVSAAGIHTLSNVGVGTTNPTSALTVKGNTSLETLSVSGVSTFAGITTVTGPTLFTNQLSVSGFSTSVYLNVPGSALFNSNDAELSFDGNLKFKTLDVGTETVGSQRITGAGFGLNFDGSLRNGILFSTAGTDQANIYHSESGLLSIQNTKSSGGQISFSVNAPGAGSFSEIVRIKHDAVGIGTTLPTSALTVKGNTSLETLNVSGVSTFNSIKVPEASSPFTFSTNNKLVFGNDLNILSTNTTNYILTDEKILSIGVETEETSFASVFGLINVFPANDLVFGNNSYVTLGFGTEGNNTKLTTIGAGVTITGQISASAGVLAGLSTFTTIRVANDAGNNTAQYITVIGQNSVTGFNTGGGYPENKYFQFSSGNPNFILENVGIGTTNATSKLTVRGGDISVGVSTAHGVILTSPNGTQYRLIVDDSGTLSTVAV